MVKRREGFHTKTKVPTTPRPCIQCRTMFDSPGPGYRRCKKCTTKTMSAQERNTERKRERAERKRNENL